MENNDLDKVWVTAHTTINLGNYENVKIEMGESHSIHPEKDTKEYRSEVRNELADELLDDLAELKDIIKEENLRPA